MLAHAIEETDFAALDPADFTAEWKWDGIRVQAVAGAATTASASRGSIRAPARTSPAAFPISSTRCDFDGAIDGELLIVRDGRVQSFNVLQQRLNRKTVTPKLIAEFPGASARLRSAGRRRRGSARAAVRRAARAARSTSSRGSTHPRIDLSPLIPFATWEELTAARADPAAPARARTPKRSKA